MNKISKMVLVGMVLSTAACNKAPESFTIGKLEITNTLSQDSVPSGFYGYNVISYNSVTYPWKLKVGQQIKFSAPMEFYTAKVMTTDFKNKHGIYYNANNNVLMDERAGVLVGKYVGKAQVCVSVHKWGSYGLMGEQVYTDIEVKGITRQRLEFVCSYFEVVQ